MDALFTPPFPLLHQHSPYSTISVGVRDTTLGVISISEPTQDMMERGRQVPLMHSADGGTTDVSLAEGTLGVQLNRGVQSSLPWQGV
jgi:hypothetical protein